MNDTGFRYRRAADFNALYRSGHSNPTIVIERALAAAAELDRHNPPLKYFISLDEADVRAQAEASRRRWQGGCSIGPLDGVPVAVKDDIDVRGYGSTCGTAFLGGTKAAVDALSVTRFREAGAIIFGKTNMHELGMDVTGINVHHGVARNPHDPARDTGGSSSGSAGAVASGVVPIALGTDCGGSVRMPASLCGVPSIKGTFGRFPLQGVSLVGYSLEHAGPLASSVEDVALGFSIGTREPVEERARSGAGLAGLRIGICDHWWSHALDDVASIAERAVAMLVTGGAVKQSIVLPHIDLALTIGLATMGAEAASAMEPHLLANRPFSTPVRVSLDIARGLSAVSFIRAQRVRALLAADFAAALGGVDVIITPTTATTAPRHPRDALALGQSDEAAFKLMARYTFALNLTGLPAAQVPCGYNDAGLPVGLQIIGAHGADWLTLAVAREVERVTECRKPMVWFDLLGEKST
jgi:Asp-tRNA(Asn)/Glu-tRNA(Gln) amidotransferase A subunit family amidase